MRRPHRTNGVTFPRSHLPPLGGSLRPPSCWPDEVSAPEVRAHCAKEFARWQLPDEVLFVDELPLTSTGKLDKKRIRADLKEQGYTLPDLRD